jgi:hypothetical protein
MRKVTILIALCFICGMFFASDALAQATVVKKVFYLSTSDGGFSQVTDPAQLQELEQKKDKGYCGLIVSGPKSNWKEAKKKLIPAKDLAAQTPPEKPQEITRIKVVVYTYTYICGSPDNPYCITLGGKRVCFP